MVGEKSKMSSLGWRTSLGRTIDYRKATRKMTPPPQTSHTKEVQSGPCLAGFQEAGMVSGTDFLKGLLNTWVNNSEWKPLCTKPESQKLNQTVAPKLSHLGIWPRPWKAQPMTESEYTSYSGMFYSDMPVSYRDRTPGHFPFWWAPPVLSVISNSSLRITEQVWCHLPVYFPLCGWDSLQNYCSYTVNTE